MTGYWHIPAIVMMLVIFASIIQQVWLIIPLFLWIGLLYVKKRAKPAIVLACLAIALYVTFLAPTYNPPQDRLEPFPRPLTAKITSQINQTIDKIEFTIRTPYASSLMQVVYFKNDNKEPVDLSVHGMKHGAVCEIHGKTEWPPESTNPGEFNYRDYLAKQHIYHQIILGSLSDVTCSGQSHVNRVFELRQLLQSYVETTFEPETAAWLHGLIFGDDSGIDPEIINLFRRWSLSHLLAISGLHVGLVIAIVYTILVKFNLLTREKANWLMLGFLPLYALIAGGEPSVWRASLMAGMFILMKKWGIKGNLTDVLSVILIVVVLLDPYIVYHIGFQFSFLVTFGLLLSKNWLATTGHMPFFTLLKIGFISQMMILPLQITYFYTFNPLSILLNVVVIPYFTIFVIPVMFVSLVIMPVTGLVHIMDTIFIWVHQHMLTVLNWVDNHLYMPFIIGSLPVWVAVIYYVLLFWMMFDLEKERNLTAFKHGCAIVLLLGVLLLRPYLSPMGTVTMLDIGQGDALVIELPYKKGVIMIDAGEKVVFGEREMKNKVFRQVIEPFLLSRGIGQVDAMFLTHQDFDHVGSADALVENFKLKTIYVSDYYEQKPESAKIWDNNQVSTVRVRQKMTLQIGGELFTILSPGRDWGTPNENSLVISAQLGGRAWLFTGDAGIKVENHIVDTYPNLAVDVLRVGHHGSKTSSDPDFIKSIQPEYGLISAGRFNRYGHPAPDVVETLADNDIKILRTDRDGAVIYTYQNNSGRFLKYIP